VSLLLLLLLLQIERYNMLLVSVRRSCVELVKGIKGLVVMSADLDQVRDTPLAAAAAAAGQKGHRHWAAGCLLLHNV
jgi:dynein heavy chain